MKEEIKKGMGFLGCLPERCSAMLGRSVWGTRISSVRSDDGEVVFMAREEILDETTPAVTGTRVFV